MIAYVIINKINGKIYVGIAKDTRRRWAAHRYRSKTGKSDHLPLYAAFKKYGLSNFEFRELACALSWDDLCALEIDLIRELQTAIPAFGYNATAGGEGALGLRPTPEQRAKNSASNKGRKLSAEHRARIGAAITGRSYTAETRAKIGAASSARRHTDETRARIGANQNGRVHTQESREKRRTAMLGRKLSAERIEAMTGRTHSDEAKAKMSATRKGKPLSAETRARMSAAKTGIVYGPMSEETKAKIRASRAKRVEEKRHGVADQVCTSDHLR